MSLFQDFDKAVRIVAGPVEKLAQGVAKGVEREFQREAERAAQQLARRATRASSQKIHGLFSSLAEEETMA